MSIKIAVIVSTTRPNRVGRKVADWFMAQIPGMDDATFDLIDLKEENFPFLDEPESPSSGKYTLEHNIKWSKKITDYDGFIFVTAEYNNGPPATLKNAIDRLYHEWDKKPVAFVGYGTYGATRAVEQLVNTTAKIGMAPLPKTFVGIIKSWEAFDDKGNIKSEYLMGNIEGMLDNLLWWAKVLKEARDGAK